VQRCNISETVEGRDAVFTFIQATSIGVTYSQSNSATSDDLEWRSVSFTYIESLCKCYFVYSCTVLDRISPDAERSRGCLYTGWQLSLLYNSHWGCAYMHLWMYQRWLTVQRKHFSSVDEQNSKAVSDCTLAVSYLHIALSHPATGPMSILLIPLNPARWLCRRCMNSI